MPVLIFLLFLAELLFALWILRHEGLLRTRRHCIISVAVLVALFFLRLISLEHETLDYIDWISRWVGYFRDGGAWKMLGEELWACNYNVPYLYALSLISLVPVKDLYLVKLLSVFFDILLAWWTEKLIALFTVSPVRRLTACLGVLALPTVLLNGAYWGQCDSIYAAFAVLSLYLALSDRPIGSVIAIAVSFSIKLQAIFLMPVFLVLVFAKKIRFRQLFFFPLAYVATLLPAVLAGRNIIDLLLLYYNNTGSIGDGLNYNSSSVYALADFDRIFGSAAAPIGIALAFVLCIALFAWAWSRRKDLNNTVLLCMALSFCIGVPFLLPHMHDRYFFLADILSFAVAVLIPWEAIGAVLVSFGSLLGYYAYLRLQYLAPMSLGGIAMGMALILAFACISISFPKKEKMQLTNERNLL